MDFAPKPFDFSAPYTWTAAQTIDLGTGALPTSLSNIALTLAAADGTALRLQSWGFAASALNINGRAVGGTRATPAATELNRVFVAISGFGYDTALVTTVSGSIQIVAGSLWAAGNRETAAVIQGTSNGSTTNTEWLRIKTLGQIQQLSGSAPTENTFPGNILFGCNNATAATAGQVGEVIFSVVSAVAVAGSGTVGNITSISLTAGVWAIGAFAVYAGGATGLTVNSTAKLSIVTTTATNGTSGSTMTQESVLALLANGLFAISINNIAPVSPTATTTYYLTEEVTYAAGSPTASATIFAIRIR